MHYRALLLPGPFGDRFAWGWRQTHRRHHHARADSSISSSSSDAASASGRGSYLDRVKGWQGPWKAALTSGSLSATGDLLAQLVQHQIAQRGGKQTPSYDPSRTLRMFGFGVCLYGPLQFYWYNWLNWLMPVMTTGTFLTKVAANQLVLAPVTVSSVLSWNLAWQGQTDRIQDKLKSDMLPTMMNGWKFWIPAASINFYAMPIEHQVLYMSVCGVLWTAYLSFASSTKVAAEPTLAPVTEAAKPAGKGKKK